MTRGSTTTAASSPPARLACCWTSRLRRYRGTLLNALLLPLMILQRKVLRSDADHDSSDVAPFPALARRHPARYDRDRACRGPCRPALSCRRIDPSGRDATLMLENGLMSITAAGDPVGSAPPAGPTHPVGLSMVVPVYRGAATRRHAGRRIVEAAPGRLEIVLVNDGKPGQFRRCSPRARRDRHGAAHLYRARPQFPASTTRS